MTSAVISFWALLLPTTIFPIIRLRQLILAKKRRLSAAGEDGKTRLADGSQRG